MPKDNDVAGYTEDNETDAKKKPGVQVGRTDQQIEDLIDGAGSPFMPIASHNVTAFAWQMYKSTTSKNTIWIWQCSNNTTSKALYDYLLASVPAYSANTWSAETVGSEGRIADTGAMWRINFIKGAYYVEVRFSKETANNDAAKADAEAFAKFVAGKIP
jgi:hypothetical protein